ncbi:MAG: hypothetical protein K2N82_12120, partial [Lachnospiraceae bacterium]|nr:hypothetical protein [Lachnospiraceae bacterium]
MKKYTFVIGIVILFLSGCTYFDGYKLNYVPEIGFSNRVMTVKNNYICWQETLFFGDSVYKLDNGIYKKTGDSIYDLFHVDRMPIYEDIKQYNNLVAAMAEDMDKFLVYDLNSQTVHVYDIYGEGNKALYTWYVYNGKIYYMVQSDMYILDRRFVCMDMATGDNEEFYFPTQDEQRERLLLADFAMREDGAVMAEIYNRDTKEMEYRRICIGEDGEVSDEKIWATDQYLY